MNTQDLKHTKGEWRTSNSYMGIKGNKSIEFVVHDTEGLGRPSFFGSLAKLNEGLGKEESEANAKLIAAAPDLLEVAFQSLSRLKKYEERIENEGKVLSVNDISLMFRLEEALQKATE